MIMLSALYGAEGNMIKHPHRDHHASPPWRSNDRFQDQWSRERSVRKHGFLKLDYGTMQIDTGLKRNSMRNMLLIKIHSVNWLSSQCHLIMLSWLTLKCLSTQLLTNFVGSIVRLDKFVVFFINIASSLIIVSARYAWVKPESCHKEKRMHQGLWITCDNAMIMFREIRWSWLRDADDHVSERFWSCFQTVNDHAFWTTLIMLLTRLFFSL